MTKLVMIQLENGAVAPYPAELAENDDRIKIVSEDGRDFRGVPRAVEFPEEPAPTGYEALSNDRLKELIDERNEGREGSDVLPKGGSKADLAARLTADDQKITPEQL